MNVKTVVWSPDRHFFFTSIENRREAFETTVTVLKTKHYHHYTTDLDRVPWAKGKGLANVLFSRSRKATRRTRDCRWHFIDLISTLQAHSIGNLEGEARDRSCTVIMRVTFSADN